MSMDGHLLFESLMEEGLLGVECPDLPVSLVRELVATHFNKSLSGLSRVEQLINKTLAVLEVYRNDAPKDMLDFLPEDSVLRERLIELRMLLALYMELLCQTAALQSDKSAILGHPGVQQFLRSVQRYILPNLLLSTSHFPEAEDPFIACALECYSALVGQVCSEMLMEMRKAGVKSPFGIDIARELVPGMLENEVTGIGLRAAIERMAIELLEEGGADADQLTGTLADSLLRADFHIVIENLARVLGAHRAVWAGPLMRARLPPLVEMARRCARIGHAHAELIAKVIFANSTKVPDPGAFRDVYGASLILAKLAELLADEADDDHQSGGLDKREVLELLAEHSQCDLALIGPLLREYAQLYESASEFLHFLLHSVLPSLISPSSIKQRILSPSPKKELAPFVSHLLAADPKMEKVPEMLETVIPHLMDSASVRHFFTSFCDAAQSSAEGHRDRLASVFDAHPQLGTQIADAVLPVLGVLQVAPDQAPGGTVFFVHRVNIQLGVGAEEAGGPSRRQWYSEFEWEQEHSALELLASCPWAVPQFDQSLLFRRLLQFSLNQHHSFLCELAFRLLCVHFSDEFTAHWAQIYDKNRDNEEVRNALLLHIQTVLTYPATPSSAAASIDAAVGVLETVAEMAEDEESEEILGNAMELYRKLREAKWKKEEEEGDEEQKEKKKKWERIGQTLASRADELEQEKRGRERKRTMIEMMEDLVPAMSKSCSVRENPMTKDCY